MKQAVRQFAEAVAEMYVAKAEQGYAPSEELEEFAGLLTSVDWAAAEPEYPPAGKVPGLRHLQTAIAAGYAAGDCPVLDALRLCVGLTPWETFYARTDWSQSFLDDFASGELIGPAGFIRSDLVSLGLFVLGPDTVYTDHAHDSTEVYYVLGGRAAWAMDSRNKVRTFTPGELVFTKPNQRHEIRTFESPLLAAWTWKSAPSATSYYYRDGPWTDGPVVAASRVNRPQ